jgi:hypothetical protein
MAFSYDGHSITQAGTDTSLAGLTGLTGVTTVTISGGLTIYILANSRIQVEGTLSFTPRTERIIFDDTCGKTPTLNISGGGTLSINGEQTLYGTTDVPDNVYAVTFLRNGSHCCSIGDASINVDGGGTFNLHGANIYTNHLIYFNNFTTISIRNAHLNSDRIIDSGNNIIRIRNYSGGLTLKNVTFKNIQLDQFNTFPVAPSNIYWRGSATTFQLVSAVDGGTNGLLEIKGIRADGTKVDGDNWRNADLMITNPENNEALRIINNNHSEFSADPTSSTRVMVECNFTAKTATGTTIASASLFLRDANNGNRQNGVYASGAQNFVDDRTYFASANGSGVFPQVKVLAYVIRGGTLVDPSTITYDFRSHANSFSNGFDFIVAAYGYLPAVVPFELAGNEGDPFKADTKQVVDPWITQSNVATVAGYSTLGACSPLR